MIRNTYGDLLKPAKIGTMQLKNHICMEHEKRKRMVSVRFTLKSFSKRYVIDKI